MLLLDAMKGSKPKKKPGVAWAAAGALSLIVLVAAVPAIKAQTTQGSALVEMLTAGTRSKEIRAITESSDAYLTFNKDIERAAVGSAEVLKITTPSKREIVLNGAKVGRTSVTVWFTGGGSEQFMIAVTRDLSVLENALKDIALTIQVQIAADRDAVVLTGSVPDEAAARRAVQAAESYVKAGKSTEGQGAGQVISLLKVQAPAVGLERRIQNELERMGASNVSVRRLSQGASPDDQEDVFVIEGSIPDLLGATNASHIAARLLPGEEDKRDKRVISRITITDQPTSVEAVMQTAIRALGCPKVTVRRVVSTEFPGDGDIVVLTGSVPTQTHLVRTVTLASKIFQQQELVKKKRDGKIDITREVDPSGQTRTYEKEPRLNDSSDDIKVVADESGALRLKGNNAFQSGSGINSVLNSGSGSSGTSSTGQGFARLLSNQVESNIARAKALEMADGRVLSFLSVEDIPEVRVDIKLYEISRTALLSWNSAQSGTVSDFQRPSTLRKTFVQNPVTGEFVEQPQAPTSNEDVQNIVSFLAGGIANRFQISGNHLEINSLLTLLEREGIARSLSSPQLTVLSGELAFFGVGGTVPIENSVVTQFGSGINAAGSTSGILNQTVERDFGIRLSVRPLVEEDGMITLDVIPSISQPDAELTRQIRETTGQTLTTTAFEERSLRTSARLRDGQTLLIGGLMSRTRTDDSNQVPGLHQVPVVGNLFKGYSYGDEDRELVIVVNPVIVREPLEQAPMWAFPSTHELMRGVPTKESLKAKQEAEAAAAEKQ